MHSCRIILPGCGGFFIVMIKGPLDLSVAHPVVYSEGGSTRTVTVIVTVMAIIAVTPMLNSNIGHLLSA